jgi:hypothetical protein
MLQIACKEPTAISQRFCTLPGTQGKKLHSEGFGVRGRKSHGDFYKVKEGGVVMDIKDSDILYSLILKGQATNFLKFRDKLHEQYFCFHVGIVQYCACMRSAAFDC